MSIETSELPIIVGESVRANKHVMHGLAQRAFQLANYDMTPDNAVAEAIERGLIVILPDITQSVAPPMPIRRMPGNGSFA